jgi:hypothetical protein
MDIGDSSAEEVVIRKLSGAQKENFGYQLAEVSVAGLK